MPFIICTLCSKTFNTSRFATKDSICFKCALRKFVGDNPPEEGDFNTARIVSGEMAEEDERALRASLDQSELGSPEWIHAADDEELARSLNDPDLLPYEDDYDNFEEDGY